MKIIVDDSQPDDSVDRWMAEATFEGEGDPLWIPMHWHKVSFLFFVFLFFFFFSFFLFSIFPFLFFFCLLQCRGTV